MRDKPEILKEFEFGRFLDAAELAAFSPEERWQYEQSLKHYRDMRNVVTTAYDDGQYDKAVKIARKLKAEGWSIQQIAELTDLDAATIKKL